MLETIYSDRCQNLNSHFLTISSLKEEIYCSKKVDPWPCQFLKKNVEKRFFMYDMCFYVLSTLSNWAASWNMKGSFKHPYCPLLLGDLSGSHITLSTTPPIRFLDTCIQFLTVFSWSYFLTPLLLPKLSSDLKYSLCPPARDWGSRVTGLVLLAWHYSPD